MEDDNNIDDLLYQYEQDTYNRLEYKKSYFVIKRVTQILSFLVYILYVIFFIKRSDREIDFYLVIILIESAAITGHSIFMISAIVSMFLSFFVNKKYTYYDRFLKIFWILALVMSILSLLAMSIFYYGGIEI